MALRVAIIAHACRSGGGLFQTQNLFDAFKRVTNDEEFFWVFSEGVGFDKIELPTHSQVYTYRGRHNMVERYAFELIQLPKMVKDFQADVIYSPVNIGLTNPGVPQALFIRNAYLFYPKKYYPDLNCRLRLRIQSLKMQLRKSLKKTQLIFCQTPVVKKRFSQYYHYPPENICVLGFPPPAEINIETKNERPAIYEAAGKHFNILMMCSYMPHKNPAVLISLCKTYGADFRKRRIRFVTTVEPSEHPNAPLFLRDIQRFGCEDLIINNGSIARENVAGFISHCEAFWLPTLLECLSTTHLEALALNVPVLAPDIDFAQHVCGQAAVYYDPWDIDSIYAGIIQLYENPALRNRLTEKGRQQLQDNIKFPQNWDEVAQTTLSRLRGLAHKSF